jgi:hypothetical protein
MPLKTSDLYSVGKVNPVLVGASPELLKKVTNAAGGKLFYKVSSDVKTSDTEVAVGSSVTFEATNFLISETESKVIVENQEAVQAPGGKPWNVRTWQPIAATSGTDTACTNGTAYVGAVFLPKNSVITGISYLIGSVGGTDKVVASLHSNTGALLANSAVAGATVGTAETVQNVELIQPYEVKGPMTYFVGLTFNGTTAKFRTIPAQTQAGEIGNGVTQTFGTPASFTAPTTFTANKVPVAFLT